MKPKAFPRFGILRQFFILILVLGLAGGFFYVAFFSSFFNITKITLEKQGNAVSTSALAPFLDRLKGKNLLFLQTSELEREIEQTFKNEIFIVKLKKSYPHRIIVRAQEYPAVLNLRIASSDGTSKIFVLNQIGVSILENAEEKELPLLVWRTAKKMDGRGIIIEPEKLTLITEGFIKFQEFFRMKVREGEWKKTERELHLRTERNFAVWLDLTQNIEKQLKKLKRSLAKLDIYHEPLEYIDLRISGGENEKVIFKRK